MAGWGEYAAQRVKPGVTVFNFSHGGYSSKTCVERVLDTPEVQAQFRPGNMLIIGFGGNDSKATAKMPDRATTPEPGGTFEKYLGIIIDAGVKAGMFVHLITPMPHGKFTDGKLDNSRRAAHAEAVGRIAKQRGLPFIDAFTLLEKEYSKFGEEEVKKFFMFIPPSENWPEGRADWHFNVRGAELAWSVFEAEIRRRGFPLVRLLTEE